MAFIGEIGAMLKADNTDFRAKMDQAGKDTQKLEGQFKKFGLGFVGFAAIKMPISSILDAARDLTGPLDENQRRAKEFALGIDQAKAAMVGLGVQALGVVNGLGEWIGKQIAIVRYGGEQVALAEKIEQQTRETLETIEKQKKITEEVNRIKEQTAAVDKKSGEEANKQLDLATRIAAARSAIAASEDAIQRTQGDQVATAKAHLQVAEARGDLIKLEGEQIKQNAAEEKKAAEDAKRSANERMSLLQKKAVLQFEALSTEEKIHEYEKSILTLTELIAAKKKDKLEVDFEEVALMENQNDLARLRNELSANQKKAESAVTAEIKEQNKALTVGLQIRGRYNEHVSNQVLEDKVRTLTADLSVRRQKEFQTGGYDPLLSFQDQQLTAAQAELSARSTIQKQVARYGEEGAANLYRGNMPEFERLMQFVTPPAEAKRTSDTLFEINERLKNSGIFPRYGKG